MRGCTGGKAHAAARELHVSASFAQTETWKVHGGGRGPRGGAQARMHEHDA
jgi:hypothetical protein